MAHLLTRQRLFTSVLNGIHAYFRQSDAVRLHPPALVLNPGMEPSITPFSIGSTQNPAVEQYFLHTSPEFAIKSCLYQLPDHLDVYATVRTYRDEMLSQVHAPEFTMLEWYRRNRDYTSLMHDVEQLLQVMSTLTFDGKHPEIPEPPYPRVTYTEACRTYVGVDADNTDPRAWFLALSDHGVDIDESTNLTFLESVACALLIEPNIVREGPCFLIDYPVRQASLARTSPEDSSIAERVEFFLPFETERGNSQGLELANGFSELVDPSEQRQRFEKTQQQLREQGKQDRPMPEHVLLGLEQLEETAGMALGIDRLVIWLAKNLTGESWTVADLYAGQFFCDQG